MDSFTDRKIIRPTLFLLVFLYTFCIPVYAMVDYSDEVSAPTKKRIKKRPIASKNIATKSSSQISGKRLMLISDFELVASYETISLKNDQVSLINLASHFQTPYNFYLDFEYYTLQSDTFSDALGTRGYERGNPKAQLGLQWFEFGESNEKVSLDLLLGLSYKSTGAHVSSRTDKFIGIQTMKRFYSFALGLSYKVRATGHPHDVNEMAIGNISTFTAELAVMVSSDIQFSILAVNNRISKSSLLDREHILLKDLSFSYVMPKLTLGIGENISIDLGGVFRTDRVEKPESLYSARLWDMKGIYGNSIFAGLNFNL